RELVAFGNGLSGTTRYIALGDNANSRGAADMGLYPDLLPGYVPAPKTGMNLEQMMGALRQQNLSSLYVAGANPFRLYPVEPEALKQTFLVVQDLFLTETAQHADVVLPALCAYEKAGTVTNTCGEVQAQRRGGNWEGGKSDLEILHLLADAMGAGWGPVNADKTLQEIRTQVPGYDVSLARLLAGESVMTAPKAASAPANGGQQLQPNRDTLFTAGTLGRYSATLNSVLERHSRRLVSESEATTSPLP